MKSLNSSKLAAMTAVFVFWAACAMASVSLVGEGTRFYDMASTETAQGTLVLQNNDNEAVTVNITMNDLVPGQNEQTMLVPPGSSPRSNAGWISITQQSITLGGGERGIITYKISPPNDGAKRQGLYWSVLFCEPQKPVSVATDAQNTVSIRTLVRYAVKILTQVNGPGNADMAFLERKLTPSPKGHLLSILAENKGLRLLKPAVSAELFGATGQKIGRYTATSQSILPGFRGKFEFNFGTLAAGDYRALIMADNGDDAVFAAEYELHISE